MQPKASLSSAGELEPKNKEIKSDSIPGKIAILYY